MADVEVGWGGGRAEAEVRGVKGQESFMGFYSQKF